MGPSLCYNDAMKILNITAQKPHSTGSGTYLTELVRAFDRMGIEQAVVAGIYPGDEVAFTEGVTFFPIVFSASNIPFPIVGMSDIMPYPSTRYRDMTDDMIAEFRAAFIGTEEKPGAVRKAVAELDPDIIICHHLFLLTAMVREAFPERRIYGICHGTDLRQMINCDNSLNGSGDSLNCIPAYISPEIRRLDRILALHNAQAEQIAEVFRDDIRSRTTVIGSGYNAELFNTDNRILCAAGEPVRICYAGKVSTPKGIPELLDAIEQLSCSPFSLTLAGGCLEEHLLSRIHNVSDSIAESDSACVAVNYLGQIPQPELAALFAQSDILVLPSFYEGLPLVLIEAMACGLRPICTDLPGVREWIDSNVVHSDIRYISMPEMAEIDRPTDEGRRAFTEELAAAIKDVVTQAAHADSRPQQDTSHLSWDALAERIKKL